MNSIYVYCLRSHKLSFLATFLLKMDPIILFTHLKIISLQCFQFQFSVSVKISSIQTHHLPLSNNNSNFNENTKISDRELIRLHNIMAISKANIYLPENRVLLFSKKKIVFVKRKEI